MTTKIKVSRKAILESISFLVILLFIYTAVSKLLDIKEFTGAMNNQPFDNKFTPYLVVGIPSMEIITALLILVRRWQHFGYWLSTILMLVFTGYVGLVLFHFYTRVPCSCGGIMKELGWTEHFILNLFFLGISIWGIFLTRGNNVSDNMSTAKEYTVSTYG